jgi:hypothetical protein
MTAVSISDKLRLVPPETSALWVVQQMSAPHPDGSAALVSASKTRQLRVRRSNVYQPPSWNPQFGSTMACRKYASMKASKRRVISLAFICSPPSLS